MELSNARSTISEQEQERIPPGWDYNPAAWRERLPIILLAFVGGAIATYLALYQYGLLSEVWEPVFGPSPDPEKNSSEFILSTDLSYPFTGLHPALRVSDAALGAFAYYLDVVTGAIGGRARWRTLPWMVILFAILVGPLGLVSVLLTVAQPVLFGQWCALCLATAVISALMVGPAMDEALASLQFMRRVYDTPEAPFWQTFWGRSRWNTLPAGAR